jgi:SagB-type dehydrogenase family enzyme
VTTELTPSVAIAGLVHGGDVPLDDPAETFHEASRLAPATALAQLPGLRLLQEEPALQASVERAARRHRHRPGIALGKPRRLRVDLGEALARRRSSLGPVPAELERRDLSTVLAAAQGARRRADGLRRPAPSGGALYPLELYPVATAVRDVPAGVYHYDPYEHRLAELAAAPPGRLADTLVDPSLLDRTAVAVAITASFWRTRFKYGQRGYRFALLEAGHVAQNLLLAAAALRLPALPLGGFYDRRLEQILGVDGLEESALYLVLLGGRP